MNRTLRKIAIIGAATVATVLGLPSSAHADVGWNYGVGYGKGEFWTDPGGREFSEQIAACDDSSSDNVGVWTSVWRTTDGKGYEEIYDSLDNNTCVYLLKDMFSEGTNVTVRICLYIEDTGETVGCNRFSDEA
jgi:hypothetical protein